MPGSDDPRGTPRDIVSRSSRLAPAPGGRGGPPGAPAPSAVDRTLVVYPPDIFPPKDAVDFYRQADQGAVTGPVTITPAGLQLQLRAGFVGVIRDLTIAINDMLVTTVASWTLRFNQGPVEGWAALTLQPRAAAFVSAAFLPDSTVVRVPDGALVDWSITVTDGGTYRIGASYHGWYYSKAAVERFR